jgi:putative oxidoreductase
MLAREMDRHQVSLGLFFLRMIGGGLLIHGRAWTWMDLVRPRGTPFADPFGMGGEFQWFLTLFTELFCTIFFMLGILTRFTAFPPMVVMLVTGLALPAGTAWSVREGYLLLALPFFTVTFTGPGDYSFDGRVASWTGTR